MQSLDVTTTLCVIGVIITGFVSVGGFISLLVWLNGSWPGSSSSPPVCYYCGHKLHPIDRNIVPLSDARFPGMATYYCGRHGDADDDIVYYGPASGSEKPEPIWQDGEP